jgi:hypothetical protein
MNHSFLSCAYVARILGSKNHQWFQCCHHLLQLVTKVVLLPLPYSHTTDDQRQLLENLFRSVCELALNPQKSQQCESLARRRRTGKKSFRRSEREISAYQNSRRSRKRYQRSESISSEILRRNQFGMPYIVSAMKSLSRPTSTMVSVL